MTKVKWRLLWRVSPRRGRTPSTGFAHGPLSRQNGAFGVQNGCLLAKERAKMSMSIYWKITMHDLQVIHCKLLNAIDRTHFIPHGGIGVGGRKFFGAEKRRSGPESWLKSLLCGRRRLIPSFCYGEWKLSARQGRFAVHVNSASWTGFWTGFEARFRFMANTECRDFYRRVWRFAPRGEAPARNSARMQIDSRKRRGARPPHRACRQPQWGRCRPGTVVHDRAQGWHAAPV